MLVLSCAVASLAIPSLPRVVISGGTHGNEYTGVYVLQRLDLQAAVIAEQHPSLQVETLFANPASHEANRRFVDVDLNRQFSAASLADTSTQQLEAQRARVIEADLGPKGPGASASVVIDMHTTTANMGCTIIVGEWSELALKACAYVHAYWDSECDADDAAAPTRADPPPARHPLRVIVEPGGQMEAVHVASIASDASIEIEVGPVPQSMLRSDVVASTERCLRLLLRYLELHYAGRAPALARSLHVYEWLGKVPFVEGNDPIGRLPGAVVAASVQDRDFEPLQIGAALFEHIDGTVVPYDGAMGEVVYPVFINEAAYYLPESGRGVGMSRLVERQVPV